MKFGEKAFTKVLHFHGKIMREEIPEKIKIFTNLANNRVSFTNMF